jgi:phosphohistidine phosphatase SixA
MDWTEIDISDICIHAGSASLLSQHGKAAWHEKDREREVSLTGTAVNHRIEEWRLIVREAKAHPEL